MRSKVNLLTVETKHPTERCITKPYSAVGDGLEDGLHVRLRPADNSQDVRGGRLAFQRLTELLVALLQLLEQAHVFDGDHRLAREGLQECDLRVGERTHLPAEDGEG